MLSHEPVSLLVTFEVILVCKDFKHQVKVLETAAQPDVTEAALGNLTYFKGLPFEFLLAFTLCHL